MHPTPAAGASVEILRYGGLRSEGHELLFASRVILSAAKDLARQRVSFEYNVSEVVSRHSIVFVSGTGVTRSVAG